MKGSIELRDTFNGITISRHRSIEAAVRAAWRHTKAVKRTNGENSYIPHAIVVDGVAMSVADAAVEAGL